MAPRSLPLAQHAARTGCRTPATCPPVTFVHSPAPHGRRLPTGGEDQRTVAAGRGHEQAHEETFHTTGMGGGCLLADARGRVRLPVFFAHALHIFCKTGCLSSFATPLLYTHHTCLLPPHSCLHLQCLDIAHGSWTGGLLPLTSFWERDLPACHHACCAYTTCTHAATTRAHWQRTTPPGSAYRNCTFTARHLAPRRPARMHGGFGRAGRGRT